MNSVYWILAVLHILLSSMYAYDCYMEREHPEEAVPRGIIRLTIPVFGYLLLWLLDYSAKRNSEEWMCNLCLGNQRVVDGFSLLRPTEKQGEINKVPVLEVLAADDYRYCRKVIMDTLKDEDIISYPPVLKRALENEDTGTSHHANAVIMGAQKRAHEYLMEKEATSEANPDDREVLGAFKQEPSRVLFGDIFDERDTRKYFSVHRVVLDRLLKLENRKDAYFHNRTLVDLGPGGAGHISQTCEAFEREHPDSKDMVVDTIQLYVWMGNREMLGTFPEELRYLPVFLTGKSLQYIRFFNRNGEVEV